MKVTKEQGQVFAVLPRATRKAAVLLSQDESSPEVVLEFLAPFAEFERQLYHKWFLKLSRDINDLRADPETFAYKIVKEIRGNEKVNLPKLVSEGEKQMNLQQSAGHRPSRMLGQVLDLIKRYLDRRNKFYDYAVNYIKELDMDGLLQQVAVHEESYRRHNEDQLFQLQVLKHVRSLQDYDRPIPIELFKIALQTDFSDNPKILHEQSLLVYHVYDSQCEKPLLFKQMCFDFIYEVLTTIKCDVTLINWLFRDDWISKETRDLLIEAHPMIRKFGMGVVVLFKARKIYNQWNIGNHGENLTGPEKFVVDIINEYAADECHGS